MHPTLQASIWAEVEAHSRAVFSGYNAACTLRPASGSQPRSVCGQVFPMLERIGV